MLGVSAVINWKGHGIDPVDTIQRNTARVPGRFRPTPTELKSEPVAVVAYGPSLKKTWRDLAEYNTIFTGSGAMAFLLKNGITPTYHVDSDPQAHKAQVLGIPDPTVVYLLASTIHSNYLDVLRNYACEKIELWHLYLREFDILDAIPYNEPMITGGSSVGAYMVKIARLMGYINLHFFGFDACMSGTESHAAGHPNSEKDIDLFSIPVKGRDYTTCDEWVKQAHGLLEDLDRMSEIHYELHGEGLIKALASVHISQEQVYQPLVFEKVREDDLSAS